MNPTEHGTLKGIVDILCHRGSMEADRTAFVFLEAEHEIAINYAQLDQRARLIAGFLQEQGGPGDRVALFFPAGINFISSFMGCLYAGRVAVPLYPLRPGDNTRRATAMLEHCDASLVLTDGMSLSLVESFLQTSQGHLEATAVDQLDPAYIGSWEMPNIRSETLAFIQYTSGSTGQPKGVMISHGNIIANQMAMARAFHTSSEDICVSWLPLYHDMGLIGTVLHAVYQGFPSMQLPALTFARDPLIWLETISRYGATISGAPDFAYSLCARHIRPDRLARLDLSSWRVAFNGAEPVRATTLELFSEVFAPVGFQARSFFPCYGMAEATLFMTGGHVGASPKVHGFDPDALGRQRALASENSEATAMVSCGFSHQEDRFEIVDPQSGEILKEGHIGEIWFQGPSVAAGYWGDAQASNRVFGGRTADQQGPFLRTGDLGFRYGGELYHSGRMDDLIIIRGRNYYPQDLEQQASGAHSALREGHVAAFAANENGETRLTMVLEPRRVALKNLNTREVIDAIRQTIARFFSLELHSVILLKPGVLPRTTSGKIRRAFTARSLAAGELEILASDTLDSDSPNPDALDRQQLFSCKDPVARLTQWLQSQLARVLGQLAGALPTDRAIAFLGADSMTLLWLEHLLAEQLAIHVRLNQPLEGLSLARIAELALKAKSSPQTLPLVLEKELPLSANQQAMWSAYRIAPDSAAYNLPYAVRIQGQISSQRLFLALEHLHRRHGVLRTRFFERNHQPLQYVAPLVLPALDEVDTRAWDENAVLSWLEDQAWRPFDLENGPLLRLHLLRAEQTTTLLWNCHHIIGDFWSLALWMDELARLYSGEIMPPPGPDYSAFVLWQQERDFSRELSWWAEKLAISVPPLELPRDNPQPGHRLDFGASHDFSLSEELCQTVRHLAEKEGVTLYQVLLSGWALLLSRYSGQDRFRLGTPTSGRILPVFDQITGCFVNPVVLDIDLRERPDGHQLLARIREMTNQAFAHGDVPYSHLTARHSHPPGRDLFRVVFALQQAPTPFRLAGPFALRRAGHRIELSGLDLESMPIMVQATPFELALWMVEEGNKIHARMEFNTDIYDEVTIGRMASHFRNLLKNLAEAPHRSILELPIMDREENLRLIEYISRGERISSSQTLPHRLFEEQAQRTPEAIALVQGDQEYSYRQVQERVWGLAQQLIDLGVEPETVVPVLANRCPEQVIAFLAIQTAGAVLLPLDPEQPAMRRSSMLNDSGARIMLTQRALTAQVSQDKLGLLYLEEGAESGSRVSAVEIEPDNLTYIMYTSGSSGKPKGVGISYQAFANHLAWSRANFPMSASSSFLHITSCTFDIALWEIMLPLISGARLVLGPLGVKRDPSAILDLIDAENITDVHFVPTLMRAFLQANGVARRATSLKNIYCGGETMPARLMARFFERLDAGLHHFYGPTESTINVTAWACEPFQAVSLGNAIQNSVIYVVDRNLLPVPTGVPGQLVIGGKPLARGYLNQPARTAFRFVPDPLSGEFGARLYLSGDIGRRNNAGNLIFIGRADHQIKLRGHRIEPGEVEFLLEAVPKVKRAIVGLYDNRLVAWIEGPESDPRPYLREHLPANMVPALIVYVKQWPLNENGKLDRSRLPLPSTALGSRVDVLAIPRNQMEQSLADIWCAVLNLKEIGINDNFFELGGDSISAIQVVNRAAREGLNLNPNQLFQHQTIARLAAACGDFQIAEQKTIIGEAPLSPSQIAFLRGDPFNPHFFCQSILLEVDPDTDGDVLYRALCCLSDHHDALRLRLDDANGDWEQHHVAPGGFIPMITADIAFLAEEERHQAVAMESGSLKRMLNLEGPLMTGQLFLCGANNDLFFLAIHHMVVDALSWQIILDDLAMLYQQLRHGQTPHLPPKTTSYKAWSEQMRIYSESLPPHKSELKIKPMARDGNGVNLEAGARTQTASLEPGATTHLLRQGPEAILVTALAMTLGPELCLAVEAHGRDNRFGLNTARTIGLFTLIRPLYLDLRQISDPSDALIYTRKALNDADPLEYMVRRYLREEYRDHANPEVCFNYLGRLDDSFTAPFKARSRGGTGPDRAPRAERPWLLEITAYVEQNRLFVDWIYNEDIHKATTIDEMLGQFRRHLKTLLQQTREQALFIPHDFPLANLENHDLARMLEARPDTVDLYPLSPMQETMLAQTLLGRRDGVYLEQLQATIHGELRLDAFKEAWNRVIQRHPPLRTSFHWEKLTRPLQLVHDQVSPAWTIEDHCDRMVSERTEARTAWLDRDRSQGYQIDQAPLLRFALFRVADDTWDFIWSFHHLLVDGWSMSVVLREVIHYYSSPNLDLEPPPLFRDYISWHQKLETRDEEFWRNYLVGFDTPTPLPDLHQGRHGDWSELRFNLDEDHTVALEQLARRAHLTMGTITMAAWGLLLRRYSGRNDIVFGTAISGRPPDLAGAENAVGLFINSLPVRFQIKDNQRLGSWLQAVQLQGLALSDHGYASPSAIRSWSEIGQDRELYHTLFAFENYPINIAAMEVSSGLEFERALTYDRTHFPLVLIIEPGQPLVVRFVYQTRCFTQEAITRMGEHYLNLLVSKIGHLDQPLHSLSMLPEEERERILYSWNKNQDVRQNRHTIIQRFQTVALNQGDAVALTQPDEGSMTYGALNRRSNQLAHRLIQQGVGTESLVGLHVNRSFEMIIGILGILKAGGCYVPLDPDYPQERTAFVAADTGVGIVLSQTPIATQLDLPEVQVLCLDDAFVYDPMPDQTPEVRIDLANLAYIIYTSGSTGKPKGVALPHGNLVRLFDATEHWFGFSSDDVWTLFHSYAFDFMVWEMWGALIYGGRLVIVPRQTIRSPEAFCRLLIEEQVTILNQTPPAFYRLIRAEACSKENPDLDLRFVILGGEALDPGSLIPWYQRHDDRNPLVVNMYGITETTVHVTFHAFNKEEATRSASNIGIRIPDMKLYLLDDFLYPAPIGTVAEIRVGGAGLARGYLNRPALTAERFIPNPYAVTPGDRLYSSGDLGRFLQVEQANQPAAVAYVGRADYQVKIRGFRIEIGEVEAALLAHRAVRKVVVHAWRDAPGADQYLVAYLVAEEKLEDVDWRSWCAESLPDFMIPAHFIQLEDLPLTPQGKIARRLLPHPKGEAVRERAESEPRTPIEEALAEIWRRVLQQKKVGINQTFFELGGDSILGLRMVAAASRAGLPISLEQLFRNPTIASLAPVIGSEHLVPEIGRAFGLLTEMDRRRLPGEVEDAWPLTLLQKGMLFHSDSENNAYHNLSMFRLRTKYNPALFQQAAAMLPILHPVLRSAFDLCSYSEPLQLVYRSIPLPLQVIHLEHLSPGHQRRALDQWFEAEKKHHFDWNRPGLFRLTLHVCSENEFHFTLTQHHSILDGWSVATLLTQLFEYYLALLAGTAYQPNHPPLNSFGEQVLAENAALGNKQSRQFWQAYLKDFEYTIIPRRSGLRPATPGQTGVCTLAFENRQLEQLDQVARSLGLPLKSLLLAAHFRVLALLSGRSDILTGMVTSVRPQVDGIERALGLYLNTLPVRIHMNTGTWAELAVSLLELEGRLTPHRLFPMAEMQHITGGESFFETAFNYTHYHVYTPLLNRGTVAVDQIRLFAPTNIPFTANFDLDPTRRSLKLTIAYDTTLFPEDQILTIGHYYQVALEAIAQNPHSHHEDTPFFEPAPPQGATTSTQTEQGEQAEIRSLFGLIEARIESVRDRTAVTYVSPNGNEESLDYGTLWAMANRLGHHLRSLGLKPDMTVGVCLERGLDVVTALLGVLAGGGAFVPMDPDFPPERLRFMIEDCGSDLVITSRKLMERLDRKTGLVDIHDPRIASFPDSPPDVAVTRQNLAYLIYTSGSTGTPKGSMITHQSILNQLQWRQRRFGLEVEDRMLQTLSLSFGPSVWQVFWPLAEGGTIVMIPSGEHRDVAWLSQLIRDKNIQITAMVPSMLRLFLENEDFMAATGLKHLSCGGSAVPTELVDRFVSRFGEGVLEVVYGPTETTIDATTWSTHRGFEGRIAPIGTPIDNVQVFIMDPFLHPVPPEVPGEIFIGGLGVGRGYWRRPGLTAERFVPNPFSSKPGARLYRTGDIAGYLSGNEGVIGFRGRLDHQVKVRGFRIEPGELEAVLVTHPDIQEAVARVIPDPRNQENMLVAWIQTRSDMKGTQVRQFLEQTLPPYMIPSAYVILKVLPRLPNGKINRNQLPLPELTASPDKYVAPANEVEQRLVEIWQDVLAIEQVGVQDNFFELGGDSILCVRITARARSVGINLTPKHIFDHQTIANASAALQKGPVRVADQRKVLGPAPLSPIQHWYIGQGAPSWYGQALLLELASPITLEKLRLILGQLTRHHDIFQLRLEQNQEGWYQRYVEHPGDPQVLEASWPDDLAEIERQLYLSLSSQKGPLLGAALLRGDSQRILLVAHHLTVDALSRAILLEDLQSLFLDRGLPRKTSSYRDWCLRLVDYAWSEEAEAAAAWWQARPEPAPLPLDFSPVEKSALVGDARQISVQLEESSTQKLIGAANEAYATRIEDLLLSALLLTWHQWTGQREMTVDLERQGRRALFPELDLSRTMGWFTTIFPVSLVMPAHAGLGEIIKLTKEHLRQTDRYDLEFGLLQGVRPDLLPDHTGPQFCFNYLGKLDAPTEGGAFRLSPDMRPNQIDPQSRRSYLLEANGYLRDGRLTFSWTWSPGHHREQTIQGFANDFMGNLRLLSSHCLSPETGGRTPSDFPLLAMNQESIDRLIGPGWEISDAYPLSPMQQGMLFHSLSNPTSGMYCQQLQTTLTGPLKPQLLEEAWNLVLSRHDALRASFHWRLVDFPFQKIHRKCPTPWLYIDANGRTGSEIGQMVNAYVEDDRIRAFDLEEAPLMRFALFSLDAEKHILVWSHHHLLLDGWSLPLVLQDLGLCYRALKAGTLPPPPGTQPYRNFIAWLGQQKLSMAAGFWTSRLQGFSRPTPLPDPSPGQTEKSISGIQIHALSQNDKEELYRFSREHHLTPNTLFSGAWSLLLSHFSGMDDVVFGTTVAGRSPALNGMEHMVGLMINTLPLRVRFFQNLTVTHWLKNLQADMVSQNAFSWCPLQQIKSWSSIPSGSNLFDSIVVFENMPLDFPDPSPELGFKVDRIYDFTNFPLALTIQPGETMILRLAWQQGVAGQTGAERLLELLLSVIRSIIANPFGLVEDISPSDRQDEVLQLVAEQAGEPEGPPFFQLFEHQATQHPDVIALSFGDHRLSYSGLNQQANKLGHFLLALGAGPGRPIAICMERSSELVICLLAVAKTGAAYVPLDPRFPDERLRRICEDASPMALICDHQIGFKTPSGTRIIDQPLEAAQKFPDQNPQRNVDGDFSVYIIYTSGSTGQPKGVETTHAALTNMLQSFARQPGIRSSDHLLAVTTVSFDIAALELYLPLISGARLVLADRESCLDGRLLAALMEKQGITCMQATPATWRLLLNTHWTGLPHLTVLSGGETLPPQVAARLAAGCRAVFNLYGPTETTVWSSLYRVGAEDSRKASIAIGKPIARTGLYVMTARGRATSPGAPGELWIGGSGLARGYSGMPAATAARYVPDPFTQTPGSRLYRTGDLARIRQDGNLEYLGRIDHQIKLRGFRIEAGEVETCLERLAEVQQAVVMLHESGTHQRLAAWIVPAGGKPAPPVEDLCQHLACFLPDYMIPAAFVFLDAMPLTPAGKVDRASLPAPQFAKSRRLVPPVSELENLLAQIQAEVLGLEKLGRFENFFELGGDSILSIQVVARMASFGLDLTPMQLFENQNIARLAQALQLPKNLDQEMATAPQKQHRSSSWQQVGHKLPEEKGIVDAYPLSPMQRGILFHDLFAPGSAVYTQQIRFILGEPLDPDQFRAAWELVVSRHDILRTAFRWVHVDEPYQVVYEQVKPQWEWRVAPAEARTRPQLQVLAEADRRRGFQLDQAPLHRFGLCRITGGSWLFWWTHHHLLLDGWSLSLVLAEVRQNYDALMENRVPEKTRTHSFSNYIKWWMTTDQDRAGNFWRSYLAGFSQPTNLPSAEITPGKVPQLQKAVSITSESETALLVACARKHRVTLSTLCQASWALLLAAWSDREDIVFGATVSGRPPHLEGIGSMVGLFINTLPLRVNCKPGLKLHSWLNDLQKKIIQLEQFSYTPLPEIQRFSQIPSGTPLFSSILIFENYPLNPNLTAEGQPKFISADFTEQTTYPLALTIQPGQELGLQLAFDTAICDALTASRYLRQMSHLLLSLARMESGDPGLLSPMDDEEKHRLLELWNASAHPPSRMGLDQLFHQAATAWPDRVAMVRPNGAETSYAALQRQATAIAAQLQTMGIGPEQVVAVYLERSPLAVAALLGILHAGAAWLMLDPTEDPDYLGHLLTTAGIRLLLSDHGKGSLLLKEGIELIDVNGIGSSARYRPIQPASWNQTAWLIPENGSCVVVTHGNAVNYLDWVWRTEPFVNSELCCWAGQAPNALLQEVFAPLLKGVPNLIIPEMAWADPDQFTTMLADVRVTRMVLSPTLLSLLLKIYPEIIRQLAYLDTWMILGDQLEPDLHQKFREALPDRRLLHLYAAPANGVPATCSNLADPAEPDSRKIGRPIDNSRLFILGRNLQPLPVGATGRLFVGGQSLARGFSGQPAKTAEKFIPDPFSKRPGRRIYDTGDSAAYNQNGQVSLKEPPAWSGPSSALLWDQKEKPETPMQHYLAGLWEEILGVRDIGANDQFFLAGGHSLDVVKLVSRIGRDQGIEVPVRLIFDHPRLEDLARLLEQQKAGKQE